MSTRFDSIVLGPFVNNVFFLADGDSGEGVIIDATFEAEKIVRKVQVLGIRPTAVILTHGHIDHIVGAEHVREAFGAAVMIHEGDRWLYENLPEQGTLFGFRLRPLAPPDRWLKDGDVVRFGGRSIEVLHTPGHTPGSICLKTETDTGPCLFSGDTLFQGSIGRTDLWGGDLEQELSSIRRRIFTLPGETAVYPGHGPATSVAREIEWNPFFSG